MLKSLADLVPESSPARAQLAVVRGLVEEVERVRPSDRRLPSLHDQLSEELERLAVLVPESKPGEPERAIDVLLVDDDPSALSACGAILRALGHPFRVAHDAEEALAELADSPAAIVLSDWTMPGMSGLELCLASKALSDPPYFILASAFEEGSTAGDGAHGGVDDFLCKPIVVEQLEERLRAACRLIRAKRALAR